ncbi:AraC family transcriptional regulator [Solimonas sp. K1W22B-7]|uniref:AraC family transcriptional regulator n=1 Tax=Solimonas sp. K1W22B-7 TaxID=2303331 RepID=UPI000E3305C1|nr:AraC family transcriptional regulator [Solimonas sp. K1W22B-7]AXQ30382.1 AraC family transcriptional regulator [Solimonas sp. K1W22B-7]
MPPEETPRSVISANLLTQLAVSRGMDVADCLRDTGIDAATLADPRSQISAEQELRLVRNIVRELRHLPDLGLDAGLRYHLAVYGIWGFALVSSPTFRSAADIATRYLDLSYAFVRFRMEPRGRDIAVVLDDSGIPEDVRRFLLDRDFAALTNAVREMRPGGIPPMRVQFRGPRPVYAERYAELCGLTPHFDAAENSVLYAAAVIDTPLPQGDSQLARLCLEQCRQMLAARQARGGVAGKVRDLLLHAPGEMPDIQRIADALHLSPRSMRRRLEEEGTSFRELLDEVRQTLAEEMLSTGRIKLSEIALRLGYAEPASFIHAFKRWKGMSPSAFREQQLGQAPDQ